jgi:ABC-type multidrug transport system fused ATPase/permease subunit
VDVTGDWSFLWSYLRRQPARMALLGLVLVAGTALAVAVPLVLQRFIDTVTAGQSLGVGALVFAGAYVVGGLVGQALGATEAAVAESVAWRSTNELRADALEHARRRRRRRRSSAWPPGWCCCSWPS